MVSGLFATPFKLLQRRALSAGSRFDRIWIRIAAMDRRFSYSSNDFILETAVVGSLDAKKEKDRNEFEKIVLGGWDHKMKEGIFRYSLDEMKSRTVAGKERFVLQLNLKRGIERRKPEFITSVDQPFNPHKFNFTKVKAEEILCEMCPKELVTSNGHVEKPAHCSNGLPNGPMVSEKLRHIIVVNVSPLEYGHILLVPDVHNEIPQKLTLTGVELGLHVLLLSANAGLRVGFNSLCALASVNHQHLHAWYLQQPLRLESAEVIEVAAGLHEMVNMPTRAFAFQLHGTSPENLARKVFLAANYLQMNNIAHNLYMTRGSVFGDDSRSTVRVYLWPRRPVVGVKPFSQVVFNVAVAELAGHIPMYGAKNESISDVVFNVAVAELSGHVPMFAPDLYDSLSEDYIVERLQEQMLPAEEFSRIREGIRDALTAASGS